MFLIVVAVIAALLVLVLAVYQRDIAQSQVAVKGAPVVATVAGPIEHAETGQGMPVLSIHGAGGGWDQGLANVAGLFGAGFRIIAPSMLVRFLGVPPALFDTATPTERAAIRAVVRSIQPLSQRVAGINLDSTPDTFRPALERITAPTLIVPARDDLFNTLPAAEFAARTIPGAELIVYDTGGHLLVGHDEDLGQRARSFVARASHR